MSYAVANAFPSKTRRELNAVSYCFEMKKDIIATYGDITRLRECAEFLQHNVQYRAHIVFHVESNHARFIQNTLLHLDVPSDRIVLESAECDDNRITVRMLAA